MSGQKKIMNYPALLSLFCGFVSLSLEILWVRLYGFAMMSTPMAFGFVLMAYLTGISLGAWQGGRACRKATSDSALWKRSATAVAISALLTLVIPVVFVWTQGQWWRDPVIDFFLIAMVSGVLAYVFPIAHHLGTGPGTGRQGQHFAWVYTSNVIGAALGPLVTGYVLLDFLTLQQAFAAMAALQLCVIGGFYWVRKIGSMRIPVLLCSVSSAAAVLWLSSGLDSHLMVKRLNRTDLPIGQVVETRGGIITIVPAKGKSKGDDAVYGGNVYDGRTNLSIESNTNGLHRPLLVAALQPQPKRVLMVGLSIGSWLALVNGFPGVEQIDVVEINSGYLQVAQSYPIHARALRDPRVNIVIDDARRWLRLHPEKKYDAIIMNATWHWRANSSFLLSRDFFEIIQRHMAADAVMAFNATGSPDAFFTATQVFSHAYRYDNFIYAADFDFRHRKDESQAREIYSRVHIEGKNIFPKNSQLIESFLERRFIEVEQDEKNAGRSLEVITDNNGLTEFKYGYGLRRIY